METEAAPAPPLETAPAFAGDPAAAQRLPRRIPVPVLRPPAQWCKPTAVTLGQSSRVIVMADEGGVGKALARRLGSLGVSALVIEPGCPADDLDSRLTGWLAEGPVQGLYWLAALDAEPAAQRTRPGRLACGAAPPGQEPVRGGPAARPGRPARTARHVPGGRDPDWAVTTDTTTTERRRRSAAR